MKRFKKPLAIHPDSPKGREANAGVDRVFKAMDDEQDAKFSEANNEIDNIVDEGFCKHFTGKKWGVFFNMPAPWLGQIIKGKRVGFG